MRHVTRRLRSLLGATLLLGGCAGTAAQPPTAMDQAASLATPVTLAPTQVAASQLQVDVTQTPQAGFIDANTWHTLYRRAGFTGQSSVDLRAVGDIMLARGVAPMLRHRLAAWLFEPSAALLEGDLAVGNLESPFARTRRPEMLRPGPFRLPADPGLVATLAPFDALSAANNHALDAGVAGLSDTAHTLTAAGIGVLGTRGADCAAAGPAFEGRAQPLRIVAYNAVEDPEDTTEAPTCGRAWLDDAALAEIAALRKTAPTPIVVLVHWGTEYSPTPSAEQQTWARKLVAAGADLIIGAHPHVVQPAEIVEAGGRRGYVAYSLGNFVFDQPDQPATSHSVVLRVLLDAAGVGQVAAAPVAIQSGQPVPLRLDDPAAEAQFAALQAVPTTTTRERVAWRSTGTGFEPAPAPPTPALPPPPTTADIDLRGDGAPLRLTLRDGLAQLWDGADEVWRNEAAAWQVQGFATGDADNDGRFEALLELWKPDASGTLRSHPFMVGWRGGHYRVFWGGSAVAVPIQAAAIGRVVGDRNALVVLEGGAQPGDAATHVAVWTWQGWNFQQQWRSPAGSFHQLALIDLDGDGVQEIVAE